MRRKRVEGHHDHPHICVNHPGMAFTARVKFAFLSTCGKLLWNLHHVGSAPLLWAGAGRLEGVGAYSALLWHSKPFSSTIGQLFLASESLVVLRLQKVHLVDPLKPSQNDVELYDDPELISSYTCSIELPLCWKNIRYRMLMGHKLCLDTRSSTCKLWHGYPAIFIKLAKKTLSIDSMQLATE